MTVADNALQSLGGYPVALVIFAGIAIFLVLLLRAVLGKRVGFEKPQSPPPGRAAAGAPVIEGQALPAQTGRDVPDPRSELGQRLMQIVNNDPQFDPPHFITQAEAAFRAIVTGFANGDRAALQALLTPHVYETFAAAIAAREAAGERQRTEIKSIPSISIEDAQLSGDLAVVVVRFISAQTNEKLDQNGTPIPGSAETGDVSDLWTFERHLRGPDKNWRLAAARSA